MRGLKAHGGRSYGPKLREEQLGNCNTPSPAANLTLILCPVRVRQPTVTAYADVASLSWYSRNERRNVIGFEMPGIGACGLPAPEMTSVPKLHIRANMP